MSLPRRQPPSHEHPPAPSGWCAAHRSTPSGPHRLRDGGHGEVAQGPQRRTYSDPEYHHRGDALPLLFLFAPSTIAVAILIAVRVLL